MSSAGDAEARAVPMVAKKAMVAKKERNAAMWRRCGDGEEENSEGVARANVTTEAVATGAATMKVLARKHRCH